MDKNLIKKVLAVSLLGFAAICNSLSAPASAEQLRSEFETALKTSNTNAIESLLYNWQGISDETNSMGFQNIINNLFGSTIESVKLKPLDPNEDYAAGDKMETDSGLLMFVQNLPAVGIIDVKSQSADTNDSPDDIEFTYGSTNNAFYLRDTMMQQVPRAALKEKSLAIIVTIGGGNYSATGDFTPLKPPTTFTGSYAYIKEGKEIKVDIRGSEGLTNTFLGSYIRSCTVQKTSGKGWINLYVLEDGRKIFFKEQKESGKGVVVEGGRHSKDPITYEIPKFEP